jgi:tetratricopeptide (TPR) repeat protein
MAGLELAFSKVSAALKESDFAIAKSLLQQILDADPNNQQGRFTQIQVLFRLNAHTELAPLIEDTIKLFPEVPDIWFHHGNLMIAQGNYDAAVKSMVKACSKIQGKSPLIILICNALLEIGQPQVAWDLVPPGEDTDRYHIRLVRAKALAALGAPIEARAHLIASSKQPNLMEADRFYLWQASKTMGFADIELDFFIHFLKLKQTTIEDKLFLANIYLANRQPQPAAHMINTLLTGDTAFTSSDEYIKTLVLAARCANLSGDKSTAKSRLTEALSRNANSSEVLEMLVEHADETQLAQFSRQHLVHTQESEIQVSKLPLEEQKTRLMAYARIAEKTNQYPLAFEYYSQANAIEKARIQATPKLGFNSGERTSLTDSFIAEFPSFPPQTAPVTEDICPIFIVGMPRTGTTLLERIIGGLAGVKTTGENSTLSQVVSQSKWDSKHRNAQPPMAKSTQDWQYMRSQFLAMANIKGEAFFTEKMPYNFRFVGYILGMFPDAPIIHIRRDPRDVCWSIYSRFFAGGHHYSADLQWILQEYELSECLMDHFKAIAPDKILTVGYEALVHDPLIQTRRVADFCGLTWDPSCLDFHKNTTASYTSSELQVRKALNKLGIGRWRNYETHLKGFLATVEASSISRFMYT